MMMKHYGPLAATAAALALFAAAAAPSVHAFAAAPKYSAVVVANQQQQQQHRSSPLSSRHQECSTSSTTLFSTTTDNNGSIDPYTSPQLDTNAILKYGASAVTELTLFGLTFQLIDMALAQFDVSMPFPAAFLLFYATSLKSRIFNPLNNQRPNRTKAVDGQTSSGFRDRVMPSWTPPGITFPIMWLLIIGPIRAYSASLIVTSTGTLACLPIMAFILHLTIGDIWNTINNTEKRYGTSVIGVGCVVLSAANAAYQYYTVDPFAGKLLGATLLWLVTAAALITDTWRLNRTEGGKLVPLFPVVGEAETSFMWFANKSEDDDE
jgi:benzodiazapine receptor